MTADKTAILLLNIGSPEKPKVLQVWKYLTQFLNNKKVIDLPRVLRILLVNFIIIPSRILRSTRLYKRLWIKEGSPLIYYSLEMAKKLEASLDKNFKVFAAMRYGKPGYKKALKKIDAEGFNNLLIIPLFPQFAMSTTGTVLEVVKNELRKRKMEIKVIIKDQFYDHPLFIKAMSAEVKKYNPPLYDHIIFSFHGLPNRHLKKCHPGISPDNCKCNQYLPEYGKYCYRATCFATSRLLAKELKLDNTDYTVAFQSRLSKNWMSPFTDDIVIESLKKGYKRILIATPSFVADCLETLIEIGEDYRKLFKESGGEELQLVTSLNFNDLWIDALKEITYECINKYSVSQFHFKA